MIDTMMIDITKYYKGNFVYGINISFYLKEMQFLVEWHQINQFLSIVHLIINSI
jgi:hypothetical protein